MYLWCYYKLLIPMSSIFPNDIVLIYLREALSKPCNDDGFGTMYYGYTKQQLLNSICDRIIALNNTSCVIKKIINNIMNKIVIRTCNNFYYNFFW